ncbi:MAG: cytochrome c biogenesis protein ResB [Syntrophaceae bacterium]|nr:cytochrome c biogenesis protein ResB [Syntrophaceae bacterium]HOC59376.1 cytochrome c biogenesis protein ResB [Smithellaceae bacterium]HQM44964.1 cytochrome c biogenesis protein ResB [Smithellaceae bacterium]
MTKPSGIRSFFASVQLAIVLLSLIALFALIGTLVPQREAAGELAQHLSPALFSFLEKMQIFDLYSSIWFILLSTLLAVNITVCSLDRFPATWRRFRNRPVPLESSHFENLPPENRLQTTCDIRKAADVMENLLKKKYGKVDRQDEPDKSYLCAGRGHFSLFSVYVIHISILVFIAGAMIGSLFRVEGYVNLAEGETTDTIFLRGKESSLTLPFHVRCEKFTLERYPNGMPKSFRSDLTFFKEDKILHAGKLLVNHPLEVDGFRFYQASYGVVPGGKATLSLQKEGGGREVMNVAQGYTFDLPGGEGTFQVLRVEENLMEMGPAVKISVRSPKQETVFWIFQHIEEIRTSSPDIFEQVPVFNPGLFRPYTFALMGLEEKYSTGLQVNRDPGTTIVAVAAMMLICGLMLFLLSYSRHILVKIDSSSHQTQVLFTGQSYRNSGALQREIRNLADRVKTLLEEKT